MVRKTVVPPDAQEADLVPHASACLRVETGRRLVEEQDGRLVDDAEPDVEPALHPARVGARRAVGGRLEVERREHLRGARLGIGLVHAVEPALEDELAAPGLGRIGRAALRDIADPLADRLGLAAQVGAGHGRLARRGRQQRGEHAQRGGLAGPVRAEEAEDLAGADVEVDTADGFHFGLA